jgi:L-lactate utilization protein LutC
MQKAAAELDQALEKLSTRTHEHSANNLDEDFEEAFKEHTDTNNKSKRKRKWEKKSRNSSKRAID